MRDCIELMADAFRALGEGRALNPLRLGLWLPDKRGVLGLMPAWLGGREVIGAKVISVFPGNRTTPYESHQGMVLLFDTQHGCPLALVDAGAITAIRTAAVSAVATRELARADAGDLAILGSGVQARAHLEALALVRKLRRVRVWSRTTAHARSFAKRAAERLKFAVETAGSAEEAVAVADLVCTVTSSPEPVLRGEWLSRGAHVNAVGACAPVHRELDTAAVARARLFVDRRESALHEAGEFVIAKKEGAIDDSHIRGELADVLLKRVRGRASPHDITLFKSLGLAVEDIAAARHVFTQARAQNLGRTVDWGGERHENH